MMRESGMHSSFEKELIVIVARWAREAVAPKVMEMVMQTSL